VGEGETGEGLTASQPCHGCTAESIGQLQAAMERTFSEQGSAVGRMCIALAQGPRGPCGVGEQSCLNRRRRRAIGRSASCRSGRDSARVDVRSLSRRLRNRQPQNRVLNTCLYKALCADLADGAEAEIR
jgi:hypothetical protein